MNHDKTDFDEKKKVKSLNNDTGNSFKINLKASHMNFAVDIKNSQQGAKLPEGSEFSSGTPKNSKKRSSGAIASGKDEKKLALETVEMLDESSKRKKELDLFYLLNEINQVDIKISEDYFKWPNFQTEDLDCNPEGQTSEELVYNRQKLEALSFRNFYNEQSQKDKLQYFLKPESLLQSADGTEAQSDPPVYAKSNVNDKGYAYTKYLWTKEFNKIDLKSFPKNFCHDSSLTNLGNFGLNCYQEQSLQKYLKTYNKYNQNPDLFKKNQFPPSQIYMIDNNNQKQMINLMSPEMVLNVAKFPKIINPYDRDLRQEYFANCDFYKDYTSNYRPIYLQEKNEENQFNKDMSKNHFIKHKQSQANLKLKRQSGISYVKPTESRQTHVNHIYDPLTPLAIQCSNSVDIIPESNEFLMTVIDRVFYDYDDKNPLIICVIPAAQETQYRNFL